MNVKEAHIHVERGLQRYNANVYDYFQPQDIDLVLTKMQNRFIDSKFRRDKNDLGFQYDQGDLDDIENLIVSDFEVPVIQDFSINKGSAILPYNYRYLIDIQGKGYRTCLNPSEDGYAREEVASTTEYVTTYSLKSSNFSLSTSDRLYNGLQILYKGTVIFNTRNYPELENGLNSEEEKFILINTMMGEFLLNLPQGIKGVYWEKYDNVYSPDSLIVVTDTTPEPQSQGNFTGFTYETDNGSGVVTVTSLASFSSIARNYTNNSSNYICKLRVINNDRKSAILRDNAFSKTISRSPVTTLSERRVIINYDKRFIIPSISIDYIRIPNYINLSLDRGFELREHTHERICDLAIEYLKNIIEQPSYQTTLNDNILRNE